MRSRGAKVGSISYFFSGKNDVDIVFPSEIVFACGLLLEADEGVRGYDVDPDRIRQKLHEVGYVGLLPQIIVWNWEKRPFLLNVKRRSGDPEINSQQHLANAIGCDFQIWDETIVHDNERVLHDWLHIAPVLAQTRHDVKAQYDFLGNLLHEACVKPITLGELRNARLGPWEIIFASIFRLVQKARLTTDLNINPLGPETSVRRRGTFHAYQKILT
jgi:hypothetical protein